MIYTKEHGADSMKVTASYRVETAGPLLAFLLAHVKGQSRNSVKHLLSRGQVLVDNMPQTQFDCPLLPGQTVSLLPQAAQPLPFPILYEDGELIAIDKPAGLLSVGTEKEKSRTAYRLVSDHLKDRDGLPHLFVVHRLDRDTSGVLIFAKNQELKNSLQEHWNSLVRERLYLALVQGDTLAPEGIFRSTLTETKTHLVHSTHREGREAVTCYRVLDRRKGKSLLLLSLKTGRKNQIRVQLSEAGHPVLGDRTYGTAPDPLGRLALHACRLTLTAPHTGKLLSFSAPVPREFCRLFPAIPPVSTPERMEDIHD